MIARLQEHLPETAAGHTHMPAGENWVVTRFLGATSEPWLYRQIAGQTVLKPRVICWEHQNRDTYPLPGIPVHVQDSHPSPDSNAQRWLRRLCNAASGNYCGAVAGERRSLDRLMMATKPRVVLGHFGDIALRVLPVTRRHGVPLVAHFHGLDVSSALNNKWYRWSLLRYLPEFAAVIVVGSHQRQWMIDHGVAADKVHLIPCGVPTAEFAPQPRLATDAVRYLAVSRLAEGKGLAYTIRAFAVVKRVVPRASLTIVGEGPLRKPLESLVVELGLSGVTFTGPLPSQEVIRAMQHSDVFVQHSIIDSRGWCEGFGVSIAEAMSMELPVVSSRIGGIADQMVDGQTGFLVPPTDVVAMTAAMTRLAHSSAERVRMGLAGRQRMIAAFDTAQQVRKLEAVLSSVALDRPARHPVRKEDVHAGF